MPTNVKFPWGLAGLLSVALIVAAVTWLRLPPLPGPVGPPGPAAKATAPRLYFAGDSSRQNEAMLPYDPTPLFLPTQWNSGQAAAPRALIPESGRLAAAIEPKLNLGDDFGLQFPATVAVPATPVLGLGLTERGEAPLALGRTDGNLAKLPLRSGFVEAVAVGTGQVVLSQALPAGEGGPDGDWQPLEFMGNVGVAGLVGDLAVVNPSGSAPVDDFFRTKLVQAIHMGERLPPGIYLFRVGP